MHGGDVMWPYPGRRMYMCIMCVERVLFMTVNAFGVFQGAWRVDCPVNFAGSNQIFFKLW